MRFLILLLLAALVFVLVRALWKRFAAPQPLPGPGGPQGPAPWQNDLLLAIERLRPVLPYLSDDQLADKLQAHVARHGGTVAEAAEALRAQHTRSLPPPDDDAEAD